MVGLTGLNDALDNTRPDNHQFRPKKFFPNINYFVSTECARDCDLYKLVSCGKFVNDIIFSTIYKTHYLTLGHHALALILCSYLNFFELSTCNSLIVLTKPKKPKKLGV